MGFVKALIGIPLVLIVLIFASVNNEMVEFNLWPTGIHITVWRSLAIIALLGVGYVFGWLFTWMSYAKVRQALRNQKKQNKKLSKEQEKLAKEVEGLQDNIETLRAAVPDEETLPFTARLKSAFIGKKTAGGEKSE